MDIKIRSTKKRSEEYSNRSVIKNLQIWRRYSSYTLVTSTINSNFVFEHSFVWGNILLYEGAQYERSSLSYNSSLTNSTHIIILNENWFYRMPLISQMRRFFFKFHFVQKSIQNEPIYVRRQKCAGMVCGGYKNMFGHIFNRKQWNIEDIVPPFQDFYIWSTSKRKFYTKLFKDQFILEAYLTTIFCSQY